MTDANFIITEDRLQEIERKLTEDSIDGDDAWCVAEVSEVMALQPSDVRDLIAEVRRLREYEPEPDIYLTPEQRQSVQKELNAMARLMLERAPMATGAMIATSRDGDGVSADMTVEDARRRGIVV